jgi:BirA family biotin operon repressor/biotin-[acetyl-CoA-carboxylase] ligase
MLLPVSSERVPRLLQLPSIASTNAELVRLAEEAELPAFTTLVTDDQTAGRGRRGRSWVAPAGTSLAISVLLRPSGQDGVALDPSRFSWLSLAAGVAMTDAVAAVLRESVLTGSEVGFKWPNDVLVSGKKICGVLGELLPSGGGVVMGAGVNVTMTADQLPVPTATSLALEGAAGDDLPDRILSRYLGRLVELVEAYGEHGGDADASGLRAAAVERCTTLGREVRAVLPGDAELLGSAVGIDELGRLQIRSGSGRVEAVAAGDIIHLR